MQIISRQKLVYSVRKLSHVFHANKTMLNNLHPRHLLYNSRGENAQYAAIEIKMSFFWVPFDFVSIFELYIVGNLLFKHTIMIAISGYKCVGGIYP